MGICALLTLPAASSSQTTSGASLAAWGRALEIDARVLDELARFRHDGRPLSESYRRALARGVRREIFALAEGSIREIQQEGCEPFLHVSFDEPPEPPGPSDRDRPEVEETFEESLLRIEMVACLETPDRDPLSALDLYTDPEFRRSVDSRIEGIGEENGLTCIETRGVTALLDPTHACNRTERYRGPSVAAEHAQVVSNPSGEDASVQEVYFKESLKTFARTPEGLAFSYVHFSRTPGLGRISRWIGKGEVEEAEERRMAALKRALSEP